MKAGKSTAVEEQVLTVYPFFSVQDETFDNQNDIVLLRLRSPDGINRLTRACVSAMIEAIRRLAVEARPLVICGNERFFSAGADLGEIAALDGPTGYLFARMGQELMQAIEEFPAPVCAAVGGYCMGGGLDLALACHRRVAAPDAVFGHRGAALGLITGWGGTQRLPRLIGRARALQMLLTTEKITAKAALQMGLIHAVADDPLKEALRWVTTSRKAATSLRG
ncbi:MAG TPA: enoyl-CoA hydratase/isomerase family protein [Candidatus Aquilonibacter sp.]|nr:enoyl-CoA hydratase/isomerase family protein [Candidatus Aquilonibacter sp.]